MKLQDVNSTWAALSMILVFTMLGGIASLTGVDYTEPGDTFWDWNAESGLFESDIPLTFTTTYYRICFEPTEDVQQPLLYKKQSRSRTVWVKYNPTKFIHTDPIVSTELFVPTYGSKWRPVKEGDCIERGKVNKLLVVAKTEEQIKVKWSLDLEHWSIENVNIDPFILPKEQETIYDYELITSCINNDYIEYELKLVTVDHTCNIKLNKTCPGGTYEIKEYVPIVKKQQTCTEIGVTIAGKEFLYKDKDRNCLRIEDTLCCWDTKFGGQNIEDRSDNWKGSIKSGEIGTCSNIKLSDKVTDFETRSVLK